MKKIIIYAIVMCSSVVVNAQLTRGASGYTNTNQSKPKVQSNTLIENKRYLTFDIVTPFLGDYGIYFKTGFGLDWGADRYLDLKLPETMKIGVDFGISFHSTAFDDSYLSARLYFFSARIGGVYTINIADDLTLDAKITLQPTIIPFITNNKEVVFLAIRKGIGFYANYNMWRVGFQISGGDLLDGDLENTGLNSGRFDISLGFKF